MEQKQRKKLPGEPDAPDTFVSLERPDVSDVIKDLDAAEKRADEMMREQGDSICVCGDPRCCVGHRSSDAYFVEVINGAQTRNVTKRLPKHCA